MDSLTIRRGFGFSIEWTGAKNISGPTGHAGSTLRPFGRLGVMRATNLQIAHNASRVAQSLLSSSRE